MTRGRLHFTRFAFPSLFFVVVFLAPKLSAQVLDGKVDILPLAVGNSWHYGYLLSDERAFAFSMVDDGYVDIEVVGATQLKDTILWHIQETVGVHRRSWYLERQFPDTEFVEQRKYNLRELTWGDHPLFAIGFSKAFHFGPELENSLTVYRYAKGDTNQLFAIDTLIGKAHWQFAFRGGKGLEAMTCTQLETLAKYNARVRLLSQTLVSVDSPPLLQPLSFELRQNYPNPFNPTTTIRYALPHRSNISLTVFNTLGQQVTTLVNGEVGAGIHEVRFNADGLGSGVYFYKLQADEFSQVRKLCLIK